MKLWHLQSVQIFIFDCFQKIQINFTFHLKKTDLIYGLVSTGSIKITVIDREEIRNYELLRQQLPLTMIIMSL